MPERIAAIAPVLAARWARLRLFPAVFFPFGATLGVGAVVRAAILAVLRGGHQWRGVVYSTRQMRGNNRLRLP